MKLTLERLQNLLHARNMVLHASATATPGGGMDGPIVRSLFFATELGGECGEALNDVKKLAREAMGYPGSRTTREHLAHELADVVISASLIANEHHIDLTAAVREKFNEKSAEWKVGVHIDEDVDIVRHEFWPNSYNPNNTTQLG